MDIDYKGILELIGTPIYSAVVETWLKPKIEKNFSGNVSNQELDEISKVFEEYLNRSYYKHMFISTIVFKNNPKRIEEIYIPLMLVNKDERIRQRISEYPSDLLKKYTKVVVTDSAGMGKSTLLKLMFLSACHKKEGIPIFIELRKLSGEHSLIDEIMKEISSINSKVNSSKILDLIHEGDFIFFLDGYDEIPLSEKEIVTSDLEEFIDKAYKNTFVLSSRPQNEIAAFNKFKEFSIKRLSKEEAYQLLRKYDTKKVIVDKLIEDLELDRNIGVRDFLENPLMVSLLFKAYEHKNILPIKKNIFYRQVYDALYNEHDLSKGGNFEHVKNCKLDSDRFHTVLRALGFITLKDNIIAYPKDQIIDYLNKSSELSNIDFQPSLFLSDLISTVPLFTVEGTEYRWSHKSFQEYFAAQFICKDTKEDQKPILRNMYNSDNFNNYFNVLDLCYDIDYKTFRNVVIHEFLNDLIKYSEDFDQKFKKMCKFNWSKKEYLKLKSSLFLSQNFLITDEATIKKIQGGNHKRRKDKQQDSNSINIFERATEFLEHYYPKQQNKYKITFIRNMENRIVKSDGEEISRKVLFISKNSNKKYFIKLMREKKEKIFYQEKIKNKVLKRNFKMFKIHFNLTNNSFITKRYFITEETECRELNLEFIIKQNSFGESYDYLDMISKPHQVYAREIFDFDLIEIYKERIDSEMKKYMENDLTIF